MSREVNGIFEKVDYTSSSSILLHVNQEYEDYPIHWHTATEIIMPLESTYSVTMNRITYALNEGDILIIPPGELHALNAPASGRRIILLFDFKLINNLMGFSSILPLLSQPRLITKNNSSKIYETEKDLLIKIVNEYKRGATLWEACIYSLIIDFYVIIGRNHIDSLASDVRDNKQKEYIDKFNAIFNYIDMNFSEDLSLESISKVAGFSKFHFSRLFKQFTNTSFYDYLNLRRIKESEVLLLDPNLSITEIALKSGFSSISTFNRVFKSFKKCTPSEFKNLYHNKNQGDCSLHTPS